MQRFLRQAESWNFDLDGYLNRIIPRSQLYRLPTPISRFLGHRKEQKPDVGNVLGALYSFVGAFCGLAVVAAMFNNIPTIERRNPPALIASFVSCKAALTNPNVLKIHRWLNEVNSSQAQD
jgi:hypothetical protein